MQHLERDFTVVLEVMREIHGGHAARTELAQHAIAIVQGDREAGEGGRRGAAMSHQMDGCATLCGSSLSMSGSSCVRGGKETAPSTKRKA